MPWVLVFWAVAPGLSAKQERVASLQRVHAYFGV